MGRLRRSRVTTRREKPDKSGNARCTVTIATPVKLPGDYMVTVRDVLREYTDKQLRKLQAEADT